MTAAIIMFYFEHLVIEFIGYNYKVLAGFHFLNIYLASIVGATGLLWWKPALHTVYLARLSIRSCNSEILSSCTRCLASCSCLKRELM